MSKKTNKNKILITQFYNPTDGVGTSVNTLSLAQTLTENGFDVSIGSVHVEKDKQSGNVKIVSIKSVKDIEKSVSEADIVVPIVNFSKSHELFGITVINTCARLDKVTIPWIRTTPKNSLFIKNKTAEITPELYKELVVYSLKRNCCEKVICVSNAAKDALISLGVQKEKLFIVNNSVDTSNKIFDKPFTESTDKDYDVLFIARATPEKGTSFFISGLKLLVNKKPDLKVCIVGKGQEKNENIMNLAQALGVFENITFIDHVPNGDLLECISKSKVLVNTSLTESFGMAILEAMALGIPVVVPNIEGPLELTENGKFGEVFEQGNTQEMTDKVLKCLKLPSDTVKKAKLARERARTMFGVENQTKQMLSVLNINAKLKSK
jgi:glycosyltransferase involved in cell wall biosynthesis